MSALPSIAFGTKRRAALLALAACAAVPGRGDAQTPLPGPLYDCRWAIPATAARCDSVSDAAPVIGALQEAAALHRVSSHFGPNRAAWAQMLSAVRRAQAALAPDRLGFRERVLAQNTALRIALSAVAYADRGDADVTRELAREAASLIARLALPGERLRAGDVDPALAAWLGPRAAWVEQRLDGDPLMFHENVHLSTRSFRIVHSGGRRFIFSQLVAIDREWRAHVTSVVGDIKMRRGTRRDEPACIAEIEPRLARCDAHAGLAAAEHVPLSHLGGYVLVDGDRRANCISCHQSGSPLGLRLEAVGAADLDAYLLRHRARLTAALEARLAPVRAARR